jgi:hypothetical protein
MNATLMKKIAAGQGPSLLTLLSLPLETSYMLKVANLRKTGSQLFCAA